MIRRTRGQLPVPDLGGTGELIRMIGSPFVDGDGFNVTDEHLLSHYDNAFNNRVALLLLSIHRRPDWDPELETRYQTLHARERLTRSVIARVSKVLDEICAGDYVIFKSLKPYPATPNDTDVLYFGDADGYQRVYSHLLDRGYLFHEWAPTQRTLYDERGVGKVGPGKKGGTYYIDFYEDVATDYFSYMNKQRLRPFVFSGEVEGVSVPLLRPESELGVVLFHSVFPERTFQLEHFFLPLHFLASADFDADMFLAFVNHNGLRTAVRASLSIVAYLHHRIFGIVPNKLEMLLASVGPDQRQVQRFAKAGGQAPFMYSIGTFFSAFFEKLKDPYCLRTLGTQFFRMLDPRFFIDVIRSLRRRLSSEGTYHQE